MSPPRLPSRRTFLERSLAVTAAVGLAPRSSAAAPTRVDPNAKVIDSHAHLNHHSRPTWEADDRKLIAAADRLGIDQLCCSILTPRRPASPEHFRECNAWLAEAMARHAGRVLVYAYVNPMHTKEAVDEVRRCVEERGFIGVKLYNEVKCTDPAVAPIVELTIRLGVPILHHAGHLHYPLTEQPHISDGADFAELARRYPEAKIICAHICGGGDWEWTIRALRHAPTVYLDTSGSVLDDNVVNTAVKELGADRLLFGCDSSMTAGVGRIRGADLTAEQRAKILGRNMQAILRGRKA